MIGPGPVELKAHRRYRVPDRAGPSREPGRARMTRTTPSHRLFVPDLDDRPGPLRVGGEEAHHAVRVKRLRAGEAVELFDGRGGRRRGRVAGVGGSRAHPVIEIEPGGACERVGAPSPRVEVWCPAPKGDRLERMLDQLSQAGAAAWRPLACGRAEAGGGRRADRLGRVVVESAKQCGRAYLLEVGPEVAFEAAIGVPGVVVADGSGAAGVPAGGGDRVVLVGPEGGWTPAELDRARGAGAPMLRLGPHVMRLETAAVAAAALLMHAAEG